MPFISEVPSIFIQRFYTGWITLRNQLVTPIRTMGRRIIELYDTLLTGNDWEVTPQLSLKRRAGHTLYVSPNFPALNLYSWKTNTQGTIPIIDTGDQLTQAGADIEYVNAGGTTTVITTKTLMTQCGLMGIGNFLYMGNTATNLKWDGPSGKQGVTNWGITLATSAGPNLAGAGANLGGGGIAWTNPNNVTNTGVSYAIVSLTSSGFQFSQVLNASTFGFSVSGSVIGIKVTFNASQTNQVPFPNNSQMIISWASGASASSVSKVITCPLAVGSVTVGGPTDMWGTGPVSGNNFSTLVISFSTFSNSAACSWQLNDVTVTIYTGAVATPTPTGGGSFTAVNGYTYVYAYGNSNSGEISNATSPGPNTGPFTNVAYVGLPVVASTDPQVNQIRVYRTTDSGGGNLFFEILNSPFSNTTATIQDTTPDTSLQVTSQAEINLGNTPPPTGLINLEWFSGRMWGSVGNLLYASTGPETLSGTAPNSNWNPIFQWVIPGVIVMLKTGPNGMLVQTNDDCFIVRGTDITNYTVNHFVRDFGIRTVNATDTDGTNLYVFTSDAQFIQVNSSGANDIGLPIADQLLSVDPTQVYVKVNRYGLDSIVRILDTVNNVYYDFNPNQQCWNLPGILQMPACSCAGSIETSPGVWRMILCSNIYQDIGGNNTFISASLAYRDINNFQDLGTSYAPVAVFGSIQLADPGNLAKFGARGGIVLEYKSVGSIPTLSVLPNDIGVDLTNSVGNQVIAGAFTSLSVGKNPLPWPPTLGNQPQNYRSLGYYWLMAKGLSAYVRHIQFQIQAAAENKATELIGFGIFGDEKSETGAPGKAVEVQGR